MTKKELASKIVALEAQVALLQAQVAQQPHVYPATYPYPYTWPNITVSGVSSLESYRTAKYVAHNTAASAS